MALSTEQDADPRTIHVYQGVTWRGVFTWLQPTDTATPAYEPVDLSDYRAVFTYLNKAGGEALITVQSPDSDDGGIDMDIPNGVFIVHLTGTQTAVLTKDGAYELNAVHLSNENDVDRVSAGYSNLILTGEPWPYPIDTVQTVQT